MIPGESIDSMFSRFAAIANPLKSLGAEIPVKGQVSKILLQSKEPFGLQREQLFRSLQAFLQ